MTTTSATTTAAPRYLTDATTATNRALDGVWQAVKLLTGDDGLHADDHVTRAEVLHSAAELLTRAAWCEAAEALADGASYTDIGDAFHMSRQGARQAFTRVKVR